MRFFPFELEQWQSRWENRVRFNLSESGVHPLSVADLLALSGGDAGRMTGLPLGYSQGNGSDELRDAIAALYPGATRDHVLVTTGSAEANFIACWALVQPGERVVILTPTYMQTLGLARNTGARIAAVPLDPARGWEPDPDALAAAITPDTRLVVVTNPNNPSGHVLSPAGRDLVLARVRQAGAWLLADEVYQGAERDGHTTPSFWGTYDKVLAVNGLSKAYGLPGLRIGWIVGPAATIEALWRRHDYTVIGPSPLSDFLAREALSVRERIWQRTRGILNANYPVLERWLRTFGPLFEWQAPEAGAICFVRYHHHVPAVDLVERVRTGRDILLVPGEHFEMPGYLRLGYGNHTRELEAALQHLAPAFQELVRD
ncbi:MAG TPA: aminotransferase class I/II-fold pyridoxal phosphate-dependent enzyme [Gemmatimonadales bacterium]|nr:aminotransferase class I/II-fold pyridoxal phosphate-dependent enzyme [Gemmatimonadales bacterium]